MKRTLLLILLLSVSAGCFARLTLDECKRMARDNYPAIRQYGLIEQSRQYTVSNASKGWLPQVSMSATAAFFTDPVNLAGMKNELYSVNVQISQTIYDGGAIKAQRRTAEAQADVSREQTNVQLYELNSRVEQLYFGILTIDEMLKQNALLQTDLELSMKTVEGMMRGGVANRSDRDAVSVEQVKARQQQEALKASRKAYLLMLSTFVGQPLDDTAMLVRPETPSVTQGANMRPELAYYTARNTLFDRQRKALDAGLMPRVSAFGMGMYHNKLLGMMKNNIFAAGLTVSWNIGALYTRRNDIRNIDTRRQMNEVQRETFLFNTGLETANSNGTVESLRRQIALDDDIITLRERIRAVSEKKVTAGTETVNEMLRDINAVSEARQQKALHELQLMQEIYNIKNINNN